MRRWRAVLESAGAEQEIDDVALVRLQPVERDRLHRSDVEPIDVGGIEQRLRELGVLCDAAANQRLVNLFDHLILWAIDNRHKGEHVFGVRHFKIGTGAVQDGGP